MDVRQKRNKVLGERVVKALESRNMDAYYAETKEEAVQKALLLMGKEKMNPPTEEIAVLMEAEPGEKGKYLLMAGIAVLGI